MSPLVCSRTFNGLGAEITARECAWPWLCNVVNVSVVDDGTPMKCGEGALVALEFLHYYFCTVVSETESNKEKGKKGQFWDRFSPLFCLLRLRNCRKYWKLVGYELSTQIIHKGLYTYVETPGQ